MKIVIFFINILKYVNIVTVSVYTFIPKIVLGNIYRIYNVKKDI